METEKVWAKVRAMSRNSVASSIAEPRSSKTGLMSQSLWIWVSLSTFWLYDQAGPFLVVTPRRSRIPFSQFEQKSPNWAPLSWFVTWLPEWITVSREVCNFRVQSSGSWPYLGHVTLHENQESLLPNPAGGKLGREARVPVLVINCYMRKHLKLRGWKTSTLIHFTHKPEMLGPAAQGPLASVSWGFSWDDWTGPGRPTNMVSK